MDAHAGSGDTPTVAAAAPARWVRPAHLTPQVVPRPDVSPEWVEFGHRYWAWRGFTEDPQVPGARPASARTGR